MLLRDHEALQLANRGRRLRHCGSRRDSRRVRSSVRRLHLHHGHVHGEYWCQDRGRPSSGTGAWLITGWNHRPIWLRRQQLHQSHHRALATPGISPALKRSSRTRRSCQNAFSCHRKHDLGRTEQGEPALAVVYDLRRRVRAAKICDAVLTAAGTGTWAQVPDLTRPVHREGMTR
jgi:hypothetical protein